MGSANETVSGWVLNYELVWEDDSPEAVDWVQEEFEALWHHKDAYNLADFVVSDIERLAKRTVIGSVEEWQKEPEPGAPIIEAPVYRNQFGLLESQKYFVNLAFAAHRTKFGARYILADEVGLGKTIQLATTATLIALTGTKPILILVPKTLLIQWQDEFRELLNVPSAYWNGKQWIDEQGIEYPSWVKKGSVTVPAGSGSYHRVSLPVCLMTVTPPFAVHFSISRMTASLLMKPIVHEERILPKSKMNKDQTPTTFLLSSNS